MADASTTTGKYAVESVLGKLAQQMEANTEVMKQLLQFNNHKLKTGVSPSPNQDRGPCKPFECFECGGPHFKSNCPRLKAQPSTHDCQSGKEMSPQ